MGFFDFLHAPAKPKDWPPDPRWWRELHDPSYQPRPAEPRGEAPSRQTSLPEKLQKEPKAALPAAEDPFNPILYFDLVRISTDIEEARGEKEFTKELEASATTGDPVIVPLVEVAPKGPDQADEVFEFFGLPIEESRKRPNLDPWEHFIDPFIDKLERRLNEMLPEEYPGYVEFGTTEDGAFGLVYIEKEEQA